MNCCQELCPLCNGQCRGIIDHFEETGVDIHACNNQHCWRYGNSDPSAIRDDSLFEKQFKKPDIFYETERLFHKFKLGLVTKEEYIQQYLAITDVSNPPPQQSKPTPINRHFRFSGE